jgi:hypothetical protein
MTAFSFFAGPLCGGRFRRPGSIRRRMAGRRHWLDPGAGMDGSRALAPLRRDLHPLLFHLPARFGRLKGVNG